MANQPPGTLTCPRCRVRLQQTEDGAVSCRCGWAGTVQHFQPVRRPVEQARAALGEEAVCAHHPDKQAVAICEGTGDYICALCAVRLGERTYSVQHINRVGAEGLGDQLTRTLPRPDRMLTWMWIGGLVTWLCYGVTAMIAASVAILYYVKMFMRRRDDALYREMLSPMRIALATIYLVLTVLMAAAWVAIGVGLILGLQGEF